MFLLLFIGNNTFHFKDYVPKNYNDNSMYKEIVKTFRVFSNSNIYQCFIKLHIFILDQKSFEQNTITYNLHAISLFCSGILNPV